MNRHIATLLRGSHFLNFSFFFRVSSLLVVFLNSVLLCSHALCEKKCNCNLLTLIVTYVSCPQNCLRKVIPFIFNKISNFVLKLIVQISKEKKKLQPWQQSERTSVVFWCDWKSNKINPPFEIWQVWWKKLTDCPNLDRLVMQLC